VSCYRNFSFLVCMTAAHAQMDHTQMDHAEMHHAQMDHAHMGNMQMGNMNPAENSLMSLASGTSVNPAVWTMPMIMKPAHSWNLMFMAQGFVVDTQQSGPRGRDRFYSLSEFMFNAERPVGKNGAFQTNVMLSLDPATVRHEQYPLLFQTGESAYGIPLVDAQHPHDFVMALGFGYAHSLGPNTILHLYFAPVGDPAIGPAGFPHRASAAELPQAPLSHHWQDATHIANEVVTAGIGYKKMRFEASGFYGTEPNENRWNIDSGPINSWSARLWYFPAKRWSAQVSTGRLARPEALEPGDQVRTTASLHYTRPMPGGGWSSSFIWGRDHLTDNGHNLNSYLVESVLPIRAKNFITGRAELVDKDELFTNDPATEARLMRTAGSTFRIGAYTIGYTRDVSLVPHLQTGIGANIEVYSLPPAIKPYYGDHPVGGNVFIRFRIKEERN